MAGRPDRTQPGAGPAHSGQGRAGRRRLPVIRIAPGDAASFVRRAVPPWETRTLELIGNPSFLSHRRRIALICSARIPGDLILRIFDYFRRRIPEGPAFLSGFHSPMERQCLDLLIVRKIPVVLCPARSLRGMRIPRAWRTALQERRMVVVSGFFGPLRRPTARLAEQRNLLVASMADEVMIPFATSGGKTEMLVRRLVAGGVPIVTITHPGTHNLVGLGASLLDERAEAGKREPAEYSPEGPSLFGS